MVSISINVNTIDDTLAIIVSHEIQMDLNVFGVLGVHVVCNCCNGPFIVTPNTKMYMRMNQNVTK
jgi:hypothetical protein